MPSTIRLIFLGTGDFALPSFERLHDSHHDVAALITQPDRPQGRKQEILPSRIKQAAMTRGVPVHQPERVNAPETLDLVRDLHPDLLVTAAYGQILSADLLAIPPLGGINLHGSILPAYRGAAPVARAIQHGETETGVTVIRMSPRVDAGGIIAIAKTPIDPEETAGELEERLARLGAPLVLRAIADIVAGTAQVQPQDRSRVTQAPKLSKDDGRIDWSRPALEIHNLVRAMRPWPTASTTWHPAQGDRKATRLIVHRCRPTEGTGEPGQVLEATPDRLVVAAGAGAVELLSVQVPGKKAGGIADFMRGYRVAIGDRLGS
jgi:methionyl-tRNA formyltransferase